MYGRKGQRPLSSLPKDEVAGSTNCITSPAGSFGRTTAVRHDNLHFALVPLSLEPFALFGHAEQLDATGFLTSSSGLLESEDQQAGDTFSPSL